jgi:hypothetical protein
MTLRKLSRGELISSVFAFDEMRSVPIGNPVRIAEPCRALKITPFHPMLAITRRDNQLDQCPWNDKDATSLTFLICTCCA